MRLTPQEMSQIQISMLRLFSEPTCLCELLANVWFPHMKIEFNNWVGLQIQPTPAGVYDWWRSKFPEAPERVAGMEVDDAFRELTKYMLAKAMNMEYKPVKLLLTSQGDA